MNKNVKKKPGKLPKEKKKSPLGRWLFPELPSAINFAYIEHNRRFLITTVSNNKGYPDMLSRGQNNDPSLVDSGNADPSQIRGSNQAPAPAHKNFLKLKNKIG